LRKAGNMYAIHVLKLDLSSNSMSSWKTAYLNVNKLEQVLLSDKGDKLLAIGDTGTKIFTLDTNSMEVTTTFKHEKGKPGFRSQPIGAYSGGYFYLQGYFYDAEQYSQGNCMAKVDISKTGVNAFEKAIDLDDLYKKLNGLVGSVYMVSPNLCYFHVIRKDANYLVLYKDGQVKDIDHGYNITDIAGTSERVVYDVIKTDKGNDEVKLFDLKTGKTISFGVYMPYSFLSHSNSKVAIISKLNYSQVKMSFYYAKEDEKFQVKPLFENVAPGSFKLSGDGTIYAYLSTNLIIDKF
jgi:hypothetical protein